MATGTIARKMENGYGFISQEGEDDDIFFHAKQLEGVEFDALSEGDEVEFEVEETPKGLNAVGVTLA